MMTHLKKKMRWKNIPEKKHSGDNETVGSIEDEPDVLLRDAIVVKDGPQGDVGFGVVVERRQRLLPVARLLLLRRRNDAGRR